MRSIVILFFFASSALAETPVQTRVGLFYEIGHKAEKYLYKQITRVAITDDLNRFSDSVITDANGEVLMREKATIKNGLVVDQVIEQLQIYEKYTLTVSEGRATFKTYDTKDSAHPKIIEENTIKVGEHFFTGPSLEIFLKKNLDQIKSKKKSKFEFGVFEMQKSFSFDVFQTKSIFGDVGGLIPIKMELSSLFSIFVDPLFIEIDPETAVVLRYRGRTPVRKLKGGKLVPFDGDIYYEVKK